jgi:hypothetical protein
LQLNASVLDAIYEWAGHVFDEQAHQANVKLNDPVRRLAGDIVVEALTWRSGDPRWRDVRPKLNELTSQSAIDLFETVLRPACVEVAAQAAELAKNRTFPDPASGTVLLVDVLEVISRKWTGIFPFCR